MIHLQVEYRGPKAEIATLTAGPLSKVAEGLAQHGFERHGEGRVNTPYKLGPLVQHFISPGGRSVIRIPNYGGVQGESRHLSMEATAWILWKAGVKILIVGGTSGVADWRTDEVAVHPGDMVFPWSFRTSTKEHGGLPGTEFENSWPEYDLLLDAPFCTGLQAVMAEKAQEYVAQGLIGKVVTPQDTRVALVIARSFTFETDYDILICLAISRCISNLLQPDRPPVITLHGDCWNPVLIRNMGIHLAYWHFPVNYAQGLGTDSLIESLHGLSKNFVEIALDFEPWLLDNLTAPTSCVCIKSKHVAPTIQQ